VSPGLTYAVIRSHALIADLLTPDQLRALAEADDLDAFMDLLSKTPYGQLSVSSEGDISMALEKLLYSKFTERMSRVVNVAPTRIAEFLETYYYMRFEVTNLKRILRGKFSAIPDSQLLDSLIPMEPFHIENFEELVRPETLEGVVELLGGTTYSTVAESMELFKRYDALWPLELALNHMYARTVLRSVDRLPGMDRNLVRRIVEVETDVENFLIAMKQRRVPEESRVRRLEDLFPVTYGIGLNEIREVIEGDALRPVVEALGQPYVEILSPIYEGDVALIRTRLRLHDYTTARKGRASNDYGFNAIMAYLVFCEVEKDDLVGISWGKAQGVPSEDILKYLVIPISE
jgi:vacuolar-type H+-ATPase subunit C/Vma6